MLALLLSGVLLALASGAPAARAPAPAMTGRRKLLHALDRMTFGPRPADADRLREKGLATFLEEQLHPEKILDEAVQKALSPYRTLGMSSVALAEAYPDMKSRMATLFGAGPAPREILEQLAAAKLLRAVYSERQLEEVMTDFWFNHFNVIWGKSQVRWLTTAYERDVIRPRVFGKFRDLLGAVAHSPAMLVYLDNFQSTVDARYAPAGELEDIQEMESHMGGKDGKGRRHLGLNENYARELMELHTLGVDGGYTQKDVTELARILTGWSIEQPNKKNGLKDFEFRFKRRLHDPGEKVLLGQKFEWAGEQEGERALDLLAKHPSTARFIALKLCRRFVADEPPAALVGRVAARFSATDGDIRETLRALFLDPEFYNPRFWRAKVKSPLEFTASVLRATGAKVNDAEKLAHALERMGQPLYLCEPPTGYPDRAEPWISSGALLARLNFALNIFNDRPDAPAAADPGRFLRIKDRPSGSSIVQDYVAAFLGGVISERTRSAILERLDHPGMLASRGGQYNFGKLAALVLGSPDFQRR